MKPERSRRAKISISLNIILFFLVLAATPFHPANKYRLGLGYNKAVYNCFYGFFNTLADHADLSKHFSKYRLGFGFSEAVAKNDLAEVEKYFKAGVNPDTGDGFLSNQFYNDGMIVGSNEMADLFLRYGANVDEAFRRVAYQGRLSRLRFLYPYLVRQHPSDRGLAVLDNTLCEVATAPDKLVFLLEKGADPNAISSYNYGFITPLMRFADDTIYKENMTLAVFEILLRHGAKINLCNKYGKTALDFAKNQSDLTVAKWLRARGAKTGSELTTQVRSLP